MTSIESTELEHRFGRLTKGKQYQFLDEINRKIAEETALGAIFTHINRTVDVGVISYEALDELAKQDSRAQFAAEIASANDQGNYVAMYSPFVDKIILGQFQPSIYSLFREGMTNDGLLAHERLHALQHRASGLMPIYDAIINAGYTQDGCFVLTERMRPLLASLLTGAPQGFEIEYFQRILREQNCAYEIAARCLTPVLEDGKPSFNLEELSLSQMGLTTRHVDRAYTFVLGALGLAMREYPDNVDMAANAFVGKHGREFDSITRWKLHFDTQGTVQEGLEFLERRSKLVQEAITLTKSELRAYLSR